MLRRGAQPRGLIVPARGGSLFLQALELDPGASRGLSFTPGLELDLGDGTRGG
ncbi:MAG: hypothetical protein AB1486_10260 [Planctomycetota bacterium]